MKVSHIEKIADAVLYEGYILYPYRPSSVKNQQRWNFGALYPESYSLAQRGTESWTMQTECLVQQTPLTTLEVRVRFPHLRLMADSFRPGRKRSSAMSPCRLSASTSRQTQRGRRFPFLTANLSSR